MNHHFREQESHASMSRRVFIGAAVAGGATIVAGEALSRSFSIEACFHEWKALFDMDYSGIEGDQLDALTLRFNELADLIMTADASNEREFAMQFYVAVDGGYSIPAEIFERRMFAILGMTEGNGSPS